MSVPKDSRILRDREQALEEHFFARENEKLKERLRELRERDEAREALANLSGIRDTAVLDSLFDAGLRPQTWAALSIVPLVEVAWASGRVEPRERRAVLAAADAHGVAAGSPSHALLENWLARRPDGRLLAAWGEYIVALCAQLDPAHRRALRDEVLGRARAVAEAAGGFLGLGNKVSSEEKVVLDELAKAFEH
jgi:hypothetical protein